MSARGLSTGWISPVTLLSSTLVAPERACVGGDAFTG